MFVAGCTTSASVAIVEIEVSSALSRVEFVVVVVATLILVVTVCAVGVASFVARDCCRGRLKRVLQNVQC